MADKKKNLMHLLAHLDHRADNYFAYDKEVKCYVVAQTWHVLVHKVDAPADEYETVYFRAARNYYDEPTQKDFEEFADTSMAGLTEHMDAGTWTAGTIQEGEVEADPEPFEFDRWHIKDIKQRG